MTLYTSHYLTIRPNRLTCANHLSLFSILQSTRRRFTGRKAVGDMSRIGLPLGSNSDLKTSRHEHPFNFPSSSNRSLPCLPNEDPLQGKFFQQISCVCTSIRTDIGRSNHLEYKIAIFKPIYDPIRRLLSVFWTIPLFFCKIEFKVRVTTYNIVLCLSVVDGNRMMRGYVVALFGKHEALRWAIAIHELGSLEMRFSLGSLKVCWSWYPL